MADRASSLHDRLNRISHWDVNVTDLERSRSWYEATTTLRVVARTKASQSFPSFGIELGSFKGYLLKDATLPHGVPMIHLVQWETPAPVGTPYRSQANVGWYRIVPIVEDIDAAREAVIAQGSEPFAPTTRAKVSFNPGGREIDYRVFTVHDPDGVAIEFVDKVTLGPGAAPQVPVTVAHNTADVDKYFPFYHELLGLDFLQGAQTQGKVPNVYAPGVASRASPEPSSESAAMGWSSSTGSSGSSRPAWRHPTPNPPTSASCAVVLKSTTSTRRMRSSSGPAGRRHIRS